jgi:hypothetical protein
MSTSTPTIATLAKQLNRSTLSLVRWLEDYDPTLPTATSKTLLLDGAEDYLRQRSSTTSRRRRKGSKLYNTADKPALEATGLLVDILGAGADQAPRPVVTDFTDAPPADTKKVSVRVSRKFSALAMFLDKTEEEVLDEMVAERVRLFSEAAGL